MKKLIYQMGCVLVTILLLVACSQEDDFLIDQPEQYKPFTMKGFVLGNSLEQYFNGVKTRDLKQRVNFVNQLGFVRDDMHMELRNKKTGEVVYQQTFHVADESNVVPSFYFDGETFQEGYDYPEPEGAEYRANFYFDFPAETGNVDVVAEVFEYYFDWDNLENPQVMLDTVTYTIVANIPVGKWSEYMTLAALPEFPKTRDDSEFWPVVCLRKSATKEFIAGSTWERSSINMQVPQSWTSQGLTQSIYVGITEQNNVRTVGPYYDLIQVFNPAW
jgi:hypothetical protein